MSDLIPNRRPVWHDAPPAQPPRFDVPLTTETRSWLEKRALPRFAVGTCRVVGALAQPESRCGHFLADVAGQLFVLHVKPEAASEDIEIAAAVAAHAGRQGAPVLQLSRSIRGRVEETVDGLAVTVGVYRKLRHSRYNLVDAAAVGRGLAKLHVALADYPDDGGMMRRTAEVAAGLRETAVTVMRTPASVPSHYRDFVLAAAERYESAFGRSADWQCTHGDVTPGNVLLDEGGEVWFTDFEDAAFSWRSPLIDLGNAVLRFALANGRDRQARTAALLSAYLATGGRRWQPVELRGALRNLVDRNWLVLASLSLAGHPAAAAEWGKFAAIDRGLDAAIGEVTALL